MSTLIYNCMMARGMMCMHTPSIIHTLYIYHMCDTYIQDQKLNLM